MAKHLIPTTINAAGLEEIRAFLVANHKRGEELFSDDLPMVTDMLRAWAKGAEFQLAEGNSATIELKSYESLRGCTQEFTVSAAGIDSEWFDDEEGEDGR